MVQIIQKLDQLIPLFHFIEIGEFIIGGPGIQGHQVWV